MLAAALLIAAGFVPFVAAPADAGTISGACTSAKGVTVIVNFASFGGSTKVVCVASATSGTTGLAALKLANFSPQGTAKDGDAFVCRLSGLPRPKAEPCLNTPPTSAYWSYWYASNSGQWTYSNLGAKSHHVILGGFEGWTFHKGSGAASAPTSGQPSRPAAAQPKPSRSSTPKGGGSGSSGSKGSGTGSSGGSGSGSSGAAKGAASGPATDHPTQPGSSPSATSTAVGATGTPTSGSISAGSTLPGDGPSGGPSPLPLALGGLGVAALLAGAGVVVSRRRRTGDD